MPASTAAHPAISSSSSAPARTLSLRASGDDILITVPVTVSEASLGAKVDVPTIDGRAQLKIPPGTQSGQKLRMRERGVENSHAPSSAATRL